MHSNKKVNGILILFLTRQKSRQCVNLTGFFFSSGFSNKFGVPFLWSRSQLKCQKHFFLSGNKYYKRVINVVTCHVFAYSFRKSLSPISKSDSRFNEQPLHRRAAGNEVMFFSIESQHCFSSHCSCSLRKSLHANPMESDVE